MEVLLPVVEVLLGVSGNSMIIRVLEGGHVGWADAADKATGPFLASLYRGVNQTLFYLLWPTTVGAILSLNILLLCGRVLRYRILTLF